MRRFFTESFGRERFVGQEVSEDDVAAEVLKVEGYLVYLAFVRGGNRCALCLEQCMDGMSELAHTFHDGNEEQTYFKGVRSVEARRAFTWGYGLELMESGRVVLLCPNCHWRYDAEGPQVRPLQLQQRGMLSSSREFLVPFLAWRCWAGAYVAPVLVSTFI